jgi:heme a synthase
MSKDRHGSAAAGAGGGRELRTFGRLAIFAALFSYLHIVFGGMVRITGSGMGCGDDWPRCHGAWIPTFTVETFIEWTHRLLAATLGFVVLGLLAYAWRHREKAGFGGPGGVVRSMALASGLVFALATLGAITVKLHLSTTVTAAHFSLAMVFIAVLLVAAVRAGAFGRAQGVEAAPGAAGKVRRMAAAAAALGFVVVAFGAVTANMAGAPQACQGFPLCNGRLLPAAVAQVHIHWTHRLLAFLLLFHMIGAVLVTLRRGAPAAVRRAAIAAIALVTAQIVVAAGLVMMHLPAGMQALHLVVGVAVWCALVVWAALAWRWRPAQTDAPVAPPLARA